MANTFLRKISNNVNTTPTTIGNYTVGANLGAVVIGMSVSNTSASQVFANVMIYNGSVEYYIIRNAVVPAEGTLVTVGNEQKVILQTGDSVRASASGNVDVIMSIMETSEIGITDDDGDGGGSGSLEGDLELGSGTVDLETETGIEDLNA